jgi:peptidoglycan/LPS O-acetylase OafA/YrhL
VYGCINVVCAACSVVHVQTNGGLWIQLFGVFQQLLILVALTRDGGRSLLGRFFRTRAMQRLGRISMTMYLLHFNLMYLACIASGAQFDASGDGRGRMNQGWGWPQACVALSPKGACVYRPASEVGQRPGSFPLWATPAVVVLSAALSVPLERWFERPARRLLRGRV